MTVLHPSGLDFRRFGEQEFWFTTPVVDVVPPIITVVSQSRQKISRVPAGGRDVSDIVFTANENLQAWKVKIVSSTAATHGEGTLIEAGGPVTAGQQIAFDVTDDELVAAAAVEGTNLIKLFGQDAAGNWSAA